MDPLALVEEADIAVALKMLILQEFIDHS